MILLLVSFVLHPHGIARAACPCGRFESIRNCRGQDWLTRSLRVGVLHWLRVKLRLKLPLCWAHRSSYALLGDYQGG
jgi:hypothetical protein